MSTHRLANELASLKDELTALAAEPIAAAASASRDKMDGAAKLVGEALQDIEQFVAHEEERIGNLISERPLASVAAAFVAGLAVGLILGRR
jgi:ElaB/YqjD/DUF883 family membrane-anchored ribosome-binding protein